MSDAIALKPDVGVEGYDLLARWFAPQLATWAQADRPPELLAWLHRWYAGLNDSEGKILGYRPEQWEQEAARLWQAFQKQEDLAARRSEAAPDPVNANEDALHFDQARRWVAHLHGFESWQLFAEHVAGQADPDSSVSRFESAVDAIVQGDLHALQKLLAAEPELVNKRSLREHHSTLLHYVSANGVEDFRQITPPNIVEITRCLLDSGAKVLAESGAYGGGSTALGLVATSYHPQAAGVQLPLMELLLERGDDLSLPVNARIVNACLANGRGQAARFLAQRGAQLDIAAAAGVGRLDLLIQAFASVDRLGERPPEPLLTEALLWACQYGELDAARFLLEKGVCARATEAPRQPTPLHWAAFAGSVELVKLLLAHGALPDEVEDRFGGTPTGWAQHGLEGLPVEASEQRSQYQLILKLLAGTNPVSDPAAN